MKIAKVFIAIILLSSALVAYAFGGIAHNIVSSVATSQIQKIECGLLPSTIASQISTSEPWYCPINVEVYVEWLQWLPDMIIAALLAFLLSSAIFMAGVVLKSAKIRNFGMAEFYEAIVTSIIVGAFIYICAVMFGLLPGFYVGTINPYATAFSLISSTINSAQALYASLYNTYFDLAFATSISVSISGAGSGLVSSFINAIGIVPNIFVNAYSIVAQLLFMDPATAIGSLLVDGIYLLYAEYYLLLFFATAAIPVFLVPGVILRALVPTRALGGTMIAMAIGFYLIMPSLFSVAYYFTSTSVLQGMSQANAQASYISNTGAGTIGAISQSNPLAVSLQTIKNGLNGFWMLILFYPALIIAVTYSFIQQFAQLIGGSYRASSRIRSFI